MALVAPHAPAKAAKVAAALGLDDPGAIPDALRALALGLGLPASYREAGYRLRTTGPVVDAMVASYFNRTSPYAPTREEYEALLDMLMAERPALLDEGAVANAGGERDLQGDR